MEPSSILILLVAFIIQMNNCVCFVLKQLAFSLIHNNFWKNEM